MPKLNLLESFPYEQSRKIQTESLEILEREWDSYDVFCISAPTGYGKTSIAKTILNHFQNVSYITPTNQLVNQCLEEFPDTPTLSRLDSYWCEEWRRPCPATRSRVGKFCAGCQCGKEMSQSLYRKGPGVYNYHTYIAHKLYRKILVVDEAQNLERFISERESVRIWRHDTQYPNQPSKLLEWWEKLPDGKKRLKKLSALGDALSAKNPTHVVEYTEAEFNGKGTIRGEPEMRPCIQLRPVDVSGAPPMFWPPGKVEKVVLLSATISEKDVESLGLARKRVAYIQCQSPIPAGRRPVHLVDLISVNRENLEVACEKIAEFVEATQDPSASHPGLISLSPEEREELATTNGIIHLSYEMSELIRRYLDGPQYLYHERDTRTEVYQKFLQSPPGTVLIACGMQEGIDLADDLARWQIVGKVPWPSLGDPAIAHRAEKDPDWFAWEALRGVIQACGRICRSPTDFGRTFLLDNSFEGLYTNYRHLMPSWFLEALIFP